MNIGVQCKTCFNGLEVYTNSEGIIVTLCLTCLATKERHHIEQIAEMERARKGEMQTYQDEIDDLKKRIVGHEGIAAVYELNFEVPPNMVITKEGIS